MPRTFALAILLLLLLPAGASAAEVSKVVDGDTLKVRSGERLRTVDLLGVDAPEAGACDGAEAKKALARLLPRGTEVRVKDDAAAGGPGRYVFRHGTLINAAVLAAGHARVAGADDLARRAALQRAEQRAKTAGKGLWKSCPPPQLGPPGTPPPAGGDPVATARDSIAGNMFIKLTQQSSFTTTEARLHLCKDGFARYDIVTISDLTGTFASTVEGNWEVLDAQVGTASATARVRMFNSQGETVTTFLAQSGQVFIDGVVQTSVERSDICGVRGA
jgi:endonuclease YncB( thermonuclease family)